MQRAFLSFFLLLTVLFGGRTAAHASALGGRTAAQDTIVVRLPNRATLTMVVRDVAQLRELKNYQLDSLTTRLASYIAQAEAAAKAGSASQVTMEFYPDKDRPGQQLPEQVRITAHKPTASDRTGRNRVEVLLEKKLEKSTGINIDFSDDKKDALTSAQRQARRDSTRLKNIENRSTKSHLIFDLGVNALVNQRVSPALPAGQTGFVDLRTEGSRYVNLGLSWDARLGGKRSPLSLTVGPEFAFNNYMLSGNNKWVSANGRTDVVRETGGRQLQKSKLATSSVNLPLMLRLQLRDVHHKPSFTVGAGGFVGYRLRSWTKLKYTSEGTTYKDKDEGSYNMENFQYGVQGTIGFRSLEFFGKYNLNGLFKAGAGPDTQVVSFGLRLIGVN